MIDRDEFAEHFIDANERMGEALTAIGMALGLPKPRPGATWGAPEILKRVARLRAMERRAQEALAEPMAHPSSISTARRILDLPFA